MLFSQAPNLWTALIFVALSRVGLAVSQILNHTQLLIHVADAYRGRVFSTIESLTWAMVMLSVTATGVASETVDPRIIGLCAGFVSSLTAVGWGWANHKGRLPEPSLRGIEPEEVEVRGVPRA
jgi:predicted acyltransferase